MLRNYGVGGWMDGLAPLQAYCNEGDGDGRADPDGWADFNFAFYSGL